MLAARLRTGARCPTPAPHLGQEHLGRHLSKGAGAVAGVVAYQRSDNRGREGVRTGLWPRQTALATQLLRRPPGGKPAHRGLSATDPIAKPRPRAPARLPSSTPPDLRRSGQELWRYRQRPCGRRGCGVGERLVLAVSRGVQRRPSAASVGSPASRGVRRRKEGRARRAGARAHLRALLHRDGVHAAEAGPHLPPQAGGACGRGAAAAAAAAVDARRAAALVPPQRVDAPRAAAACTPPDPAGPGSLVPPQGM